MQVSCNVVAVSIHAPVGGGDPGSKGQILTTAVSIHAPVGGGDNRYKTVLNVCHSFNPRPRGRGRPTINDHNSLTLMFQSTPPWEGATQPLWSGLRFDPCFNPRPRGRGRRQGKPVPQRLVGFNPRPRGRGRHGWNMCHMIDSCFNPRPRGRGRRLQCGPVPAAGCFNPRPRGRGRQELIRQKSCPASFNPRPRGRGRPHLPHPLQMILLSFNPRPRGRGRLLSDAGHTNWGDVSIHAPVGGGDRAKRVITYLQQVSIHAPVGGGDGSPYAGRVWGCCFNPRPRGRGRLLPCAKTNFPKSFQSTPPWEGATLPGLKTRVTPLVSIHAPVGGGDLAKRLVCRAFPGFNPRPRGRGRRPAGGRSGCGPEFQSTPPWEGATQGVFNRHWRRTGFNPRPRGRGRLNDLLYAITENKFQSTPPWEGATPVPGD